MFMDLSSQPVTETDKQQFCVEMMKRLDIQRRNEQFCDVILEVGSGDDQARLKAHRIVLCAASPFFYNALNSDMKEKKEGVIRLEETSKAVMEEVLEYLYTGHVDINEHNAFDLLQIADFLVVSSLKELTCNLLLRKLSPSNCINAFYTAVKFQCPELEKRAKNFIFVNFMDVTQSDDFLNLSVTQVEEWISSDDITVKGEEDIFETIVRWMERDESRMCHFVKMFSHVRLLYVSRNDVFNVILKHPLVKESATCSGLALDALEELSYGTEECFFTQPPRRCLKTHENAIVACGKKKTLCYIPSENKWYKLADMTKSLLPPYRNLFVQSTITACHGKLYITGAKDYDCVAERYDPSVNCWAPVKAFAEKIGPSVMALINFQGFLFVIDGINNGRADGSVYKYNPDTNLWQQVASLNVARNGLCAIADRHSLYAIGGQSVEGPSDVAEKFDPGRKSWSRIAATPEKRALACGAVVNGKVFVFGGYDYVTPPGKLIDVYDPAINTWSSIDWVSAPNHIYSAARFEKKVFVVGLLEQGSSQKTSLQVYDPDKNEWESCVSVPVGIQVFMIAPLRIQRDILDLCQVVSQE